MNEADKGGKPNSLGSCAEPRKLCMVELVEGSMSDCRLGRGNASMANEAARDPAGAHHTTGDSSSTFLSASCSHRRAHSLPWWFCQILHGNSPKFGPFRRRECIDHNSTVSDFQIHQWLQFVDGCWKSVQRPHHPAIDLSKDAISWLHASSSTTNG